MHDGTAHPNASVSRPDTPLPRRRLLTAAAGIGATALGGSALAQSFDFKPNQRYPDASVQILDRASASTASSAARSSNSPPACAGPRARCGSATAATCW